MSRRDRTSGDQTELGLPEVRPLWETGGLFSDHYLHTRLRQNAWWPSDDDARLHWEFCRELYNRRYLGLAKYGNEAAVRQELINKVLKQLGFDWIDNLSLPDQDAEPDYLLFGSTAEKEAVLEKNAAERYRAAAAILEAKKLNHPLSQLSKHQLRYPHQQIRDYLLDAQVLGWGILTNGNAWRLYCRDAKRHEYFELNFEVAIQSLDAFKWFLALFRPEAFRRAFDGRCRLDDIRDQAVNVQTELEENLRQRVFTILADLANGFAARPENGIGDGDLEILYQNCLIYLYRLLFVLYAEGRDLLPVNRPDRKYRKNLSLARLRSGLRNFSEYDDRHLTRLCEALRDLFRLINGANERMNKDYGVPRYNGGLFDPDKYPLLEKWAIADADLAAVLRGLMFSPPPERDKPALPIQTVDFADLRVQHLGSIYEGLLEHHLVRGEDGRLGLDVDRAERKATGTYYTPDYIVKYIVENTVGPLLKRIEESDAVKTAVAAKQRNDAFAEQVLGLNILDPAMGSGHFLVEAVTFLADHLVHHPTTCYLDADKRGEPKAEQEIAHWRRRVVEACIYGVDLNPLAVELAKLSLWLVTIATDKPLNFLDHHLRCGNSLIGARLDQLGGIPAKKMRKTAAEQLPLSFGPDFRRAVSEAISTLTEIEGNPSSSVFEVKLKERKWHDLVLPTLAPFRTIANIWTSACFDAPLSEEEYLARVEQILEQARGDQIKEPSFRYHIKELERPFFHWELEFPEVFFKGDGTARAVAGFDAVIGNPPWLGLRTGEIEPDVLNWLRRSFACARGQFDLAAVFCELAIRLSGEIAAIGEVVPKRILTNESYEQLRRSLTVDRHLTAAIDLGVAFPGVDNDAAILISGKVADANAPTIIGKRERGDELALRTIASSALAVMPFHIIPVNSAAEDVDLTAKMAARDVAQMGQTVSIDRGAECGMNHPAISRHRTQGSLPLIDHLDMNRHWVQHAGWYLDQRAIEPAVLKSPTIYSTKPKLLIRFLSSGIVAARDEVGFASTNLVYHVACCEDASFLCAILCSRLLTFWYRTAFQNEEVKFPHVQKSHLIRLPIRRIDFTTPDAERKRHGKKARQVYEVNVLDGDPAPVLSLVEEHMMAARTDVVHDLLAFLAERMTALNREKHEAAGGFLTDLKDFHGVDAHGLKPKTRLDQFWTLEVGDVFAHLKANARLLAAQGVRMKESDEDRIRSRFQKARDKIVPLETALSFTDRLIDRIVYRLYDLTPDDVRIVEGRS